MTAHGNGRLRQYSQHEYTIKILQLLSGVCIRVVNIVADDHCRVLSIVKYLKCEEKYSNTSAIAGHSFTFVLL